ncbi:hypothetical protein RSA36_14260 [Pantoea stewartii]|uniref:Uncharacterized protein n=1 Tax=Pantoea stewartii TaxID=66269 RepID=A0AB34VF15_9GAMM|nr:hypothetical protein RSA30_11760 [Pantoea stewartii]KTS96873.1 hypothetical protein RSA13_12250 [Pantoea stewartii]KTT06943.1 hypothetical protein RSA36_14260 [Pantoea stewartii]
MDIRAETDSRQRRAKWFASAWSWDQTPETRKAVPERGRLFYSRDSGRQDHPDLRVISPW